VFSFTRTGVPGPTGQITKGLLAGGQVGGGQVTRNEVIAEQSISGGQSSGGLIVPALPGRFVPTPFLSERVAGRGALR
jgi:hypothetical protein